MNFLAHLALAAPDDDLMAGGFLGDFIKGAVPADWNNGVAQGVRLHRAIDAYSDRHDELLHLREVLPSPWRRYAGIVLDLMTDHYLATNWREFSSQPLDDFVAVTQRALATHRHLASESACAVMDNVYKYQWLSRYADLDFTLEALRRIGQRMRFDNPLHRCDEIVPEFYSQLCTSSQSLYLDMGIYVAEWRSQNLPDRGIHA